MDENKLRKLKSCNYKIYNVCALCTYSNLTGFWGTCKLQEYTHQKHTESRRFISISAFGTCNYFNADENKIIQLGKYSEFR